MATKTTGRQQAKSSKANQQRSGAPRDYWKGEIKPVVLARDQFRVRVKRGDKQDILLLDREVLDVTWEDAGGPLVGSVTYNKGFKPPPIGPGHMFILEWASSAASETWYEIWRMRADAPESQVDQGYQTVQLVSDLAYLRKSKDHFKYGKSKVHPSGVTTGGIIRLIAKRYGQAIGKLATGLTHKVKHFSIVGSPYDAILKALLMERNDGSGRKYIMRSTKGKLDIIPLQRSRRMLLIGPAIINATVSQTIGTNYASAITIRGTLKARRGDKKRKPIHLKVSSAAAVRRYGYVHREMKIPAGSSTRAEARAAATHELHKRFKPKVAVTFTHPGVPTLKRWDAMKVYLPEESLNLICFVSEVRHHVSAGAYDMDVVCRFTDPFVDTHADKVAAKKRAAAKKRNRKSPTSGTTTRPKAKTHDQHKGK